MKVSLKKEKGSEVDGSIDFLQKLENLLKAGGAAFAISKKSKTVFYVNCRSVFYDWVICLNSFDPETGECLDEGFFGDANFEGLFRDFDVYFCTGKELTEKLEK